MGGTWKRSHAASIAARPRETIESGCEACGGQRARLDRIHDPGLVSCSAPDTAAATGMIRTMPAPALPGNVDSGSSGRR